MLVVHFTRKGYVRVLEVLAAAWQAGTNGGDTSTLDRTLWFLDAAGDECCCGASTVGGWTAGVHHGAHRCARVITGGIQ